jgi:hypothetical protein
MLALDNLNQRFAGQGRGESHQQGAVHHNVPAEPSSFVGREQELAELVRRLGSAQAIRAFAPEQLSQTGEERS